MTTRERWIVYPLLFLALGVALRDKMLPPSPSYRKPGVNAWKVRCVRLECQDLTIASSSGDQRIRLGETANQAGQIEIYGPNQKMLAVVGANDTGRTGRIGTFNAEGVPQVALQSTEQGGLVTTFDRNEQSQIILGYGKAPPGAYLIRTDPGSLIPLTFPWWQGQVRPNQHQPPEKEASGGQPSDTSPGRN